MRNSNKIWIGTLAACFLLPLLASRAVSSDVKKQQHNNLPSTTWYMAEGSTQCNEKGNFDTYFTIQNTSNDHADVAITYMGFDGVIGTQSVRIPPKSTSIASANKHIGAGFDFSIKIEGVNDQPIIVERTTYWNNRVAGISRQCAHSSVGVTTPSTTWYMAEGSTKGGFETYVLIQNSGTNKATVDITYMTEGGSVPGPALSLYPQTRQTVNVADTLPNEPAVSIKVTSDNPIVAERSTYWSSNATSGFRQCAHSSVGVTTPSTTWYMAEGSTYYDNQGGFDTWLLIQNPGNNVATVDVNYMTEGGSVPGPALSIPPQSRRTVNVADTVHNEPNISIQVISNSPIVVERTTYWNNHLTGISRQCAHSSVGVTTPSPTWYMAEGRTKGGFDTYVLIQNPGTNVAMVDVTYMTDGGSVPGPALSIPPQSRQTVNVADTLPNESNVSIQVTSDSPIVAERSTYWSSNTTSGFRQSAHSSIGSSYGAAILELATTREAEQAWLVKREYGKVVLTVNDMGALPVTKFIFYRKAAGGTYHGVYQALKEIAPSELQNNSYTFYDKYLEEGGYIYKVVAIGQNGAPVGTSNETTI